ncbi:exo-alpha-sialidase [Candidatus Bipolaricaulota bacterium]|nr:exo-alpha-sialidase [Candidatus Bipolaricaulota bacterium]
MGTVALVRPPHEYPHCHAPSICELTSGELLLAFYAGEYEGAPDQVILGARFAPGRGWSGPAVWVHVAGRATVNPRVFLGPDGAVWLIAPVNYSERWCSGGTYLFLKRSYDGGRTWTDLELLIERKGLLGKNKPLVEGKFILLPVEWEETWSATFLRSQDGGRTWEICGDLGRAAGAHLIQPTVVRLPDGRILAYMRSQEGRIFASYSADGGRTWSRPEPTPLPNPNSGIDMARLRSGALVLVYNPTEPVPRAHKLHPAWPRRMPVGFDVWGPRTPLVAALSRDGGRTWPWRVVLEDGEGEYSYPAVIQAADGTIHVVYTYRREAIKHVILSEDDFA